MGYVRNGIATAIEGTVGCSAFAGGKRQLNGSSIVWNTGFGVGTYGKCDGDPDNTCGIVYRFKLPKGTSSESVLHLSNFGCSLASKKDMESARNCYWAITKTAPDKDSAKPKGTILMQGYVYADKLGYGLQNIDYDNVIMTYAKYQKTLKIDDDSCYYYLYFYDGYDMRVGHSKDSKPPVIGIENYTQLNYPITYRIPDGSGISGKVPTGQYKYHYESSHTICPTTSLIPKSDERVATYSITLNANSGTIGGSNTKTIYCYKNRKYTIDGWSTSASSTTANYKPGATYSSNKSLTLYAHQVYTDSITKVTAGTPTRTGYIFDGWYENTSYTGKKYGANEQFSVSASGKKLYAKWVPISYTVKFYVDGEQIGNATRTCNYDESFALPTPAPKRGYSTSDWTLNLSGGTEVKPATALVNNLTATNGGTITATATTSPLSYTVELEIDESVGIEYDGERSLTVNYDDKLILGEPRRLGYDFVGWTTNSNGAPDTNGWENGKKWDAIEGENGILDGKLTLHPVWSNATVEIHYKYRSSISNFEEIVKQYPAQVGTDSVVLESPENILNGVIMPHHKAISWEVTTKDGMEPAKTIWRDIFEITKPIDNTSNHVYEVYAKLEPRYKLLYITGAEDNMEKRQLSLVHTMGNKTNRIIYPYYVKE